MGSGGNFDETLKIDGAGRITPRGPLVENDNLMTGIYVWVFQTRDDGSSAAYTGELEAGRFGLSHPVGPRLGPTAIGAADTVVVPALAVDSVGIRLGRGGGYYDRALVHARHDAVLVTVVFDDERVDALPREIHDRPVTAVVTPSGGWEELAPPAG